MLQHGARSMVENALNEMKRAKAPGDDGITVDLQSTASYKYGGECLRALNIPLAQKNTTIILIHKTVMSSSIFLKPREQAGLRKGFLRIAHFGAANLIKEKLIFSLAHKWRQTASPA